VGFEPAPPSKKDRTALRASLLQSEMNAVLVVFVAEGFEEFPIVQIATWQGGSWLGLDDAALLISCAEAGLVLVAFEPRSGVLQ
jgi:adenine deaminase